MQIDFNCDMGESFGPYKIGYDEELMQYISSANVAGGFHAGDPHVMRSTVALAKDHGVAVGIHNGYRDLEGFGRRDMDVSPDEIHDELIYQLGALREFARLYDVKLQHVKPHASLYMRAARDEEISRAIIEAIQKVDPDLFIYCMQASATYEVAKKMDHPVATEFFADRDYNDEGQIVFVRSVGEDLNPGEVGDRVVRGITEGKVTSVNGNDVEVPSESICIHSDTPGAVELAQAIVGKLKENDIEVRPLGRAKQRVS